MRPFLAVPILWLAGCGYVGDPKPPALNIPLPVSDLMVAQRGDKLRIAFTLPTQTIEGLTITEFSAIEVRVGSPLAGEFNVDAWAAAAKRIDVPVPVSEPVVQVQAAVGEFAGKEVICAVRTAGPKERLSEFSNFVAYRVIPPLATPALLKGTATADGVRLTWSDPKPAEGVTYRILRRAEKEKDMVALGESRRPEFVDTKIEFGKSYEYQVYGVLKSGATEAESEPSTVVAITPVDTFAPAVPAGLNALAGVSTLELAWDRNTEADFRGYNVYRASGHGEFVKIAGPIESPAFSDRMVEAGNIYRYAVSAVDVAGNESPRSQPVQISAPQ